jgi:hypothetical protein
MASRSAAIFLLLLAACGLESKPDGGVNGSGGLDASLDAGGIPASADHGRDILTTALQLDLATHHGTANITVASATGTGASFEVGDLDVTSVTNPLGPLDYRVAGGWLDVGVGSAPSQLTVTYGFKNHSNFDGWLNATSLTFLWPRFCGNLFPCHSAPADGVQLSLAVTGVPANKVAVYPANIPADAPAYMLAVAVGDYTYLKVGTTDAGTEVGVYYLPNGLAAAQTGTHNLDRAFDWYERTYGAYTFGNRVASVAAAWGPSGFGGMEHHPLWHVGTASMSDQVTHYHEAAHGWFGDGVRIACWEDFVLSEGTVSYLAARALQAVEGRDVWPSYQADLNAAITDGDTIALPSTCNAIDLIHDPLWSNVPYMKGAFFLRAVEQQVGAPALDRALAKFYREHVGQAASMQQLLDTIHAETGFDPTVLANGWLRSLGHP